MELLKVKRYEWIARQKAAATTEAFESAVTNLKELREALSDLRLSIKELESNE